MQEVEGHAEQEREQHHRRLVVAGQPVGGERDGDGDQDARIDPPGEGLGRQALGRDRDGDRQALHALEGLEHLVRLGGVRIDVPNGHGS